MLATHPCRHNIRVALKEKCFTSQPPNHQSISQSTFIFKVPKLIQRQLKALCPIKRQSGQSTDEGPVAGGNSPVGRKREQTQTGRQPSAFGLVVMLYVHSASNIQSCDCFFHPNPLLKEVKLVSLDAARS